MRACVRAYDNASHNEDKSSNLLYNASIFVSCEYAHSFSLALASLFLSRATCSLLPLLRFPGLPLTPTALPHPLTGGGVGGGRLCAKYVGMGSRHAARCGYRAGGRSAGHGGHEGRALSAKRPALAIHPGGGEPRDP